jgi:hypothetical protein
MGIFRASSAQEPKPESPALLFRDLRKDPSVKFLWEHQGKLLDSYFQVHKDDPDIAIELPTGSGKTLVGMLIGEYRRRALGERVVFLCPNKQLCRQVEAQARKYGIPTSLLIGQQKDYDQIAFSKYQQAKSIAISTYSGVFNTNPAINDPQAIICDDAHAADNYVSSMWTFRVDRMEYPEVYKRLYSALRGVIPASLQRPIEAHSGSPTEKSSVDLVSTIMAADHFNALRDAMGEVLTRNDDPYYPWQVLSQNLDACHIYCSSTAIEVRPVIPPALTHRPFAGAN